MTVDNGAAALAERLHDLGPFEQDGGVPDVCNRWPEHEAQAAAILGDHGVFLPDGREVERRLTEWAERFLGGLSFNEPSLQRRGWAKERAPDIATSIRAALEGGSE
jgi:hypothetical protein